MGCHHGRRLHLGGPPRPPRSLASRAGTEHDTAIVESTDADPGRGRLRRGIPPTLRARRTDGRDGLRCGLGLRRASSLACMFSSRLPTRLLSVLLFLTVALATVLHLPPDRAALYGVGVFVVAGLSLAKFGRVLIRNAETGAEFL